MIRALLLICLLATPAIADIRPADKPRLDNMNATLGGALRQSFATGDISDIALLTEALSGAAQPNSVLTGDWNCRTMKLGSTGPTIYRNFRCRISDLGERQFELEKLTGSQRMIGKLTLGATQTLYTGVGFVDGGPAVRYDALPADQISVEPGQTVPQVGIYEQISDTKARLMLPSPLLESDFDILYLTR